MPAPIQSLLNPSIGIQELLAMPEPSRLPQAKEMPSSVLQQTGLEQLYGTANARTGSEALLCPDVGDGRIVSPEVFQALGLSRPDARRLGHGGRRTHQG